MFEVRSVPDGHYIGTNLVRTNPPITFVIVNAKSFIWRQRSSVRPISIIFLRNFSSRMNPSWIPRVVLIFALLLELMGDVVFLVSWLLPVTVPVRSPFLYVVVRNRKEIHRALDEFLILLCSFSQEVPARAVDNADVPV